MKLFDVYPLYDVTPVKAKDVYVWDADRNKYLDLYGGHAVISIGHAHPHYLVKLKNQLDNLGFYSNAIKNPLQKQLAKKLGKVSKCEDHQLFLCNSGAEANENALKLASFATGKKRVVAFRNSFHGRTSAAVASTDNAKIVAPINAQQEVTFLALEDSVGLEQELKKGDVCAVIIECIQGVGGLDEPTTSFVKSIEKACKQYGAKFIADEVQSGFGRTGDFFAFQKHNVTPDIIAIAKGMGNGFPVGGILIHDTIEPQYGMLGTTFGGNHLACAATLAVLEVLESEKLMQEVEDKYEHFMKKVKKLPQVKAVRGRGLMLGLEFDFEVGELRKQLIYKHHIFTGGSNNKKLLRILPPLTVQEKHLDKLIQALQKCLKPMEA